MTRECPWCRITFNARSVRQSCCLSPGCVLLRRRLNQTRYHERRRARTGERAPRVCPGCQQVYRPKRSNQSACGSRVCRNKIDHLRNRRGDVMNVDFTEAEIERRYQAWQAILRRRRLMAGSQVDVTWHSSLHNVGVRHP